MTADLDKKSVTVRYNLLNLPDTIQYFDGSMTVNRYLADGTKVSSIQYTPKATTMVPIGKVCDVESLGEVRLSGTAYCDNIDYDVLSDGSLTAKRVRNSEGYITNLKNQTSSPAHYTRDIQGNVISVLSMSDGYPYQGSIYYADGLPKNNSYGTGFQPYLYSGKELLSVHGYDCYDYGARHSQTSLGRFTTPDPMAEKYYGISPYALCGGNPVFRVDYNGMDWYSYRSSDTGTLYYKWFDSSERILYDAGIRYTRYGATICAYTDDGSFIYGAQDGQTYTSAPLQEVSVFGDQSALMARSVHKAQKEFLTSDYAKMVAGFMGGMMAGAAALEYGYNAAVWSAPYVKSAAVATYNAGKYAYTVSSNAAKYYGSTAILNGVKGYEKAKMMAEIGYGIINNSSRLSFYTGLIDGFIKSFDFPPDAPYVIDNPIFSFGSNAMNGFIDILKKLVK